MALDFLSNKGIATAIGHAPGAALVDPAAGSKLAIAEALTNLSLGSAYAWTERCFAQCQLDVACKKQR